MWCVLIRALSESEAGMWGKIKRVREKRRQKGVMVRIGDEILWTGRRLAMQSLLG